MDLQKSLIGLDGLAAIVSEKASQPVLRRTVDHLAMRSLALRAGLEEGSYDDFDSSFGYFVGDVLVGCVALRVKEGVFTVECLAVSEEYRGMGLGSSLIRSVEAEAVARGAGQIWALARAPGFFLRNGYRRMDPSSPGAPSMKCCEECPQFNQICSPAIVSKTL
jgi:predicted N-acetyltransferase YhbS